jgi:hypothetical protein
MNVNLIDTWYFQPNLNVEIRMEQKEAGGRERRVASLRQQHGSVACPVCNKFFTLSKIIDHADKCASTQSPSVSTTTTTTKKVSHKKGGGKQSHKKTTRKWTPAFLCCRFGGGRSPYFAAHDLVSPLARRLVKQEREKMFNY